MRAAVGDHLHIQGRAVGKVEKQGEILEIRGDNGEPPYLVRFADGHEGLVVPGPDCFVEHATA